MGLHGGVTLQEAAASVRAWCEVVIRRRSVPDAGMRSSTSTSCECRQTSSGTSGVFVVRTANKRSTKLVPASYATNSRTANEIMSGIAIMQPSPILLLLLLFIIIIILTLEKRG